MAVVSQDRFHFIYILNTNINAININVCKIYKRKAEHYMYALLLNTQIEALVFYVYRYTCIKVKY